MFFVSAGRETIKPSIIDRIIANIDKTKVYPTPLKRNFIFVRPEGCQGETTYQPQVYSDFPQPNKKNTNKINPDNK